METVKCGGLLPGVGGGGWGVALTCHAVLLLDITWILGWREPCSEQF